MVDVSDHRRGPRGLDGGGVAGKPRLRGAGARETAVSRASRSARACSRARPNCCSEAGMLDAVMACGFQYKNGAAFVRDDLYSEFNFADKFSAGLPFTFQVPRAQFDQVLSGRSRTARRDRPLRSRDHRHRRLGRAAGRHRAGRATRSTTHRPRFVLDASGFGRTLPRLLDLDRPSDFPERAALFVHVKDNIVSGEFDRQKIRIGVHPTQQRCLVLADSVLERALLARRRRLARASREVHGHARRTTVATDRRRTAAAQSCSQNAHTVRPVGEITGYAAKVSRLHGAGFRAARQRGGIPRSRCSPRASPSR